ncbi:MAG TPA: hypothetical protein VK468_03220 [Pyrinomonadaceae bacterium]|nr:hypothetical protein [Pyrinomonadaceae bacterium]
MSPTAAIVIGEDALGTGVGVGVPASTTTVVRSFPWHALKIAIETAADNPAANNFLFDIVGTILRLDAANR